MTITEVGELEAFNWNISMHFLISNQYTIWFMDFFVSLDWLARANLLSEKIKIEFLFEKVWNYIHKNYMSCKVKSHLYKILTTNKNRVII